MSIDSSIDSIHLFVVILSQVCYVCVNIDNMNIENPKINYHKNYFVSIHNYTMKQATVTVGTSEPFITRFLKLFLSNIFLPWGN